MVRIEESVAEKIARLTRRTYARDAYDLVWIARQPGLSLDHALVRRLAVLKGWVDVHGLTAAQHAWPPARRETERSCCDCWGSYLAGSWAAPFGDCNRGTPACGWPPCGTHEPSHDASVERFTLASGRSSVRNGAWARPVFHGRFGACEHGFGLHVTRMRRLLDDLRLAHGERRLERG